MGRHVLKGELATTLWNQPYNGALDAYLLAPLLAVLPHHEAYRLYQLLCAALLVVLAGLLARPARRARRRLRGGAARGLGHSVRGADDRDRTAAELPRPARHGLSAGRRSRLVRRGPAGGGAASRARTRGCARLRPGVRPRRVVLLARDPCLRRHGGRARPGGAAAAAARAAWFAAGAAIGAAPLAVARLIGASGSKVETASSAVTAIRPSFEWVRSVQGLGHALAGIAGLQVPLVVDGKERASLPLPLVVVLAIGLALALAAGARSRRALPLLGWAAALAGAFWLSRRTGPDELRYLYGLNAPLAALAGTGIGAAWRAGAARPSRSPAACSSRGAGASACCSRPGATRRSRIACGRCRRSSRQRPCCARPGRAAPTRACSSPAGSRSKWAES